MSPVLTLFINIILHTVPEERIKQLNELLLDIRTEFGKSMREAMKERDDYKTKYPKESKESKGQYNFICYSKFMPIVSQEHLLPNIHFVHVYRN